jgi:hypothetical protein
LNVNSWSWPQLWFHIWWSQVIVKHRAKYSWRLHLGLLYSSEWIKVRWYS